MIQHIIVEAVSCKDIPLVVLCVYRPVFPQFLRCQHQHAVIAQLIILDDGQCREGFAQTDTIRNDTAAVFLNLVNGPHHAVTLELIKLVPNQRRLNARLGLDDGFFRQFAQISLKDMIKRDEIDSLRRILLIENFHFREDFFRHILHHSRIVPNTVKNLQNTLPHCPAVYAGIHIITGRRRNP